MPKKESVGYYDLWINGSPSYFTGWTERKGLENYFFLRKQENHKAILAKYQANKFTMLKYRYDRLKMKFNTMLLESENDVSSLVNPTLGGEGDLDDGYSKIKQESKSIIKRIKKRLNKVKKLREDTTGTRAMSSAQVNTLIKDLQNVKVAVPEEIGNKIFEAALNNIGTIVFDTKAGQEIDNVVRNNLPRNANFRGPREKNNNKRMKMDTDDYLINLSNTDKSIDMSFQYNNYNKKNKKSQPMNFVGGGIAELGTLGSLVDNIIYDKSINNNKRAVIYNTVHSDTKPDYYVEYNYLKESIAETYADKAFRQLFPSMSDSGILMINGELINVYNELYNEKIKRNRMIDMETIIPEGRHFTHGNRRSYSMIQMYKNYDVRLKINLGLI